MHKEGLSKTQIGVMALTAGVSVANIYYNQPILKEIALTFHATESEAGSISVLTQAGYGLGLFFITPLGDKFNRKKLIVFMLSLLILTLLGIVWANNFVMLCIMSFLMGMFAVSAQIILPMAATLETVNRGKTLGIILTGMLTGILSARVFSGFIAEWLGWRYVYGISSGLVLIVILCFYFAMPHVKQQFFGNYGQLLSSIFLQIKRFGLLRRTAVLGGLIFGLFCSFWTTLTFHLSGEPFNYRTDVIGLFGLLAIAGALMAPVVGKIADKANPAKMQLITILIIIAGVLSIQIFPGSVFAIIAAVLLIDVGVQAMQVTNIATIYTLDSAAHSRINTVYMTTYFIGGALGTFAGILCWTIGGWAMVSWQMLIWGILALALILSARRKVYKIS